MVVVLFKQIKAMQIQGEDSLIALTFDGEIMRLTPLQSKQPILNFTEQMIVSSEMGVSGKVLDFAIEENKSTKTYTISTLQEDGYLRLYTWNGSLSTNAHQTPLQECSAIQIASSVSGGVQRISCYGKALACSSRSGMTALLKCSALSDPEESSLSIPPPDDGIPRNNRRWFTYISNQLSFSSPCFLQWKSAMQSKQIMK